MATWQLIAETGSKQTLYGAFSAELYIFSDKTYTAETHILLGDFRLMRGSASARDKFGGITATQITFALRDSDSRLFDAFSGVGNYEAKLIIKKNSVKFFEGFLALTSTKKELVFDDSALNFKAFDGLTRLKEFDDWSAIAETRTKIHQLIYKTLSALEFDLDIFIFSDFWLGNTSSGSEFPFESQYAYIEDYLAIKPDASYWDVLEMLCKQFNLEIFQLNGAWVVRQNISIRHVEDIATDGITIIKIDGATGTASKNKVSLDSELLSSSLGTKPIGIKGARYDKIIFKSSYGEKWKITPYSFYAYDDVKKNQIWRNAEFEKSAEGWSVDVVPPFTAPLFKFGALIMHFGETVSQTSGDFLGGEKVKISVTSDFSRMVLSDSELLSHLNVVGAAHDNPLFRIKYIGDANTYYLYSAITADVAVNGDVETGDTTGWSSDSAISAQTSIIHGGSYALHVDYQSGDGGRLARNTATLAHSGGRVTGRVWVKHATALLSPYVELKLTLPDGSSVSKRVIISSTGWHLLEISADNHTAGTVYFDINYLDDNDEDFYVDDLQLLEAASSSTGYVWTTSEPSPDAKFGASSLGVCKGLGNYLTIYDAKTFKFEEEIILPDEKGAVKIELFGGGALTGNNYAGEYGAIHRKAAVEIISSGEESSTEAPNNAVLQCYIADGAEKVIEVPFHDLDPYGNSNFWYSTWSGELGYEYFRTVKWITPIGELPLLEAVARMLLLFHRENDGFDLKLLPGQNFNFNSIQKIDFSNSGTYNYYLPVFEDTLLIQDVTRVILLRHEITSETPTIVRSFTS